MGKQIFLIRHAPTEANLTGSIRQNYGDEPILDVNQKDLQRWHDNIGDNIPDGKRRLYISPAYRCRQTAQLLFPTLEPLKCDELKEFDCCGLGSKKFWEVSQIEFESMVHFSSFDMGYQADNFLKTCQLTSPDIIIGISHGMFIRYMYHFMTGNRDISPYEVINSKGFSFANLDMLEINMEKHNVKVYRFNDKV
jgi:broad specificity phosphatase PhoE